MPFCWPREPGERVRAPRCEGAALDRLPRGGDEIEQEAEIMQAQQPEPENLLLVDEMADVRAAEAYARRAGTAVVERARVTREVRVAHVQSSRPRQRAAGTRGACREDAVEHVDSTRDHLDDAFRVADAHEVARLLRGQRGGRLRGGREHRRALLPHRQAADRVAVEVEGGELG